MRPRFVLICHDGQVLNSSGLARWLASFTDLAGIILIREQPARLWKRIRREIRRVGWLRFADVLAFRLYYRLRLAARDREGEYEILQQLEDKYPPLPPSTRMLITASPNSKEGEDFLRELQPEIVVARCKSILSERIFRLAPRGVFVMHPGICPEYRNAHGCFWALAQRDLDTVGMTLLRIDAGVDTGPVYGYYRCEFDELQESHIQILRRVVFDNLDVLESKFREILAGTAETIDTSGRASQTWGQPWLSAYTRWKRAARKKTALLYHDVVPGDRFELSGFQGPGPNVYKLEPSEFRRHLDAIAQATRPGAAPLLTFDDGGASAFSPVAGLLEEFGWRGHFFITTDRIGTPGFLDERQIVALRRRGHIIGSHTCSHPARIVACPPDQLAREWGESARTLERILGEPVTAASIPAGYYSREIAVAAAQAGIKLLYTSEPVVSTHIVDGCTIAGRFSVQRGASANWVAAVVSGHVRPRLERYLFWNAKKLAKAIVGPAWLSLRRSVLTARSQGRASTSR
ncbi:MAG TPA: polysaccharide deacetylase family protein [Bryobacteraceae bacterium]|jgi:peptidoglycan/xylan/chitin deacetylase (PgdA/CDA1 family)